MSIVDNASAVKGDVVTIAYLNDKFDDIVIVTTSQIDDDNVRSEGIDRTTLKQNGLSTNAGIILVDASSQSNGVGPGSGTVYANTANHGQKAELSHGSGTRITWAAGQALQNTDLLRVYWHVYIDEFNAEARVEPYRQHPCWLVWLQWDVTSNALANWTEVPNQAAFNTFYADGPAPLDAYGSPISSTSGTMTIPHGIQYLHGPTVYDMTHPNSTFHRGYFYQNNTGSTITIYGLRLVIDGLYFPWCTGTVSTNRFIHVYSDTVVTDDIKIAGCYMVSLVMRGQ